VKLDWRQDILHFDSLRTHCSVHMYCIIFVSSCICDVGCDPLTSPPSSLVYVLDENEVDEDLKVIFKVSIGCLLPLY